MVINIFYKSFDVLFDKIFFNIKLARLLRNILKYYLMLTLLK